MLDSVYLLLIPEILMILERCKRILQCMTYRMFAVRVLCFAHKAAAAVFSLSSSDTL